MDQLEDDNLLDPAAAEDGPTFRERASGVFRAISGWAAGLLSLAVVVALAANFGPMRARASQIESAPVRIKFTWPPLAGYTSADAGVGGGGEPMTWVNADIRGELERTALAALKPDPFDRTSLEAARESLARTGWFRDDLRLTRGADGIVRVAGTWRIPAAAVRSDGQDGLVTNQGEVLPLRYRPEASGYKVVIGEASGAPAPGKAWLGGEVQAGLRLIDYLSTLPAPCPDQIAAVDVSGYGPSRSLVIVTEVGNRILWGGPLEDFNPGQATPAVKFARLAEVFREHGRIDAGRSVLDVRLLDGVYVHDTLGVMARSQPVKGPTKPGAKPEADAPKPRKPGSR